MLLDNFELNTRLPARAWDLSSKDQSMYGHSCWSLTINQYLHVIGSTTEKTGSKLWIFGTNSLNRSSISDCINYTEVPLQPSSQALLTSLLPKTCWDDPTEKCGPFTQEANFRHRRSWRPGSFCFSPTPHFRMASPVASYSFIEF